MQNILNFGAVSDGKTLCTKAIDLAINECLKTGEALLIPAGRFLTGTINLRGVSMHLEKGARLIASPDPSDYPVQDYVHNEMGALQAMIVSLGGSDMVIDGEGIIDLNGSSFFNFESPRMPHTLVPATQEELSYFTVHLKHGWRPNQSIFLKDIDGLTVKDITVLDAPCWTFSIVDCKNVRMSGLDVHTSLNIPNDDGMHFCCCDGVIIEGCHISSGDDCIALSGITDWSKPCKNIVISNCVLMSCSKAIVVGYQYSHIQNVVITNVIIRESQRGLCFMCHDKGGLVEHVRVSNMVIDTAIRPGDWWGNGEALLMEALPSADIIPPEQDPHRSTPVNYRDIVIDGITCTTENALGIVGTGDNYEDVTVKNVRVETKPARFMHLKGHSLDTAPSPKPVMLNDDCAFYIGGAQRVRCENVELLPFEGKEMKLVRE